MFYIPFTREKYAEFKYVVVFSYRVTPRSLSQDLPRDISAKITYF